MNVRFNQSLKIQLLIIQILNDWDKSNGAVLFNQKHRSAASDLVLHGLPKSHKKTLGLNELRFSIPTC